MYVLIILMIGLPFLYLYMICPNLSRRHQLLRYRHHEFAHRGYFSNQKLIPENSMPAFREAVKHGYGIELDVHLTKDHRVVVFHDDTLTRMCRSDHTIEEMTYDELQAYRLLNTPEKIPLLSDVLFYVNGRVPILLEIKMPAAGTDICRYTYELLKQYKGPYLVQSFNTLAVRWFSINAPHVFRGQLSSNLMKKEYQKVMFFAFLVRFLLTNWYCKPDFISYKLKDADNLSLFLMKHLYKVPVAVWTLRTKKAYETGKTNFDMVIFEKFL